jgi:hypothetical protein
MRGEGDRAAGPILPYLAGYRERFIVESRHSPFIAAAALMLDAMAFDRLTPDLPAARRRALASLAFARALTLVRRSVVLRRAVAPLIGAPGA